MIHALLLGRDGSRGFPGKNTSLVLGRPMMSYPIMAAQESTFVDKVWVSTDSPTIAQIGKDMGCGIIMRPPELCTDQALGEHAYVHGYEWIRDYQPEDIEIMVLLFCNAPTVTGALIDEGITALRNDPSLDSAVSGSVYNMWSPLRAAWMLMAV